jgi:pimeloyl-ACP methyl ester carboxylesterase
LASTYGQLIYESEVVNYQPHKLYNYYKNQICDGIYLYNCSRNIKNLTDYTGLDINQESGLISSTISSIKGYKVYYTSPNLNNQAVTMSGAVLLPISATLLKGVIIFYHYTVLDKRNIPSNFKGDAFVLSGLAAATLASDGYAVLLPDLPGMGVNGNVPHPYVIYPEVNAQSGIYLLNTLKNLIAESSFAHINGKIPLFISGYSEGGAYALWAAKILEENPQYLQQNNYKLQKTVPVVGAYNLSQVMLPFMFSNVTSAEKAPYYVSNSWVSAFAKPGFFANTINSYLSYNSTFDSQSRKVYNPAFADCLQCDLNDQRLSIPDLLQVNANDWLKYNLLFETAKDVDYSNSNNSVQLLADPSLLKNESFVTALSNADIYNWHANTAVTLLAFEFDSIVPRLSSETAYIAMTNQGSPLVKMITVPNQDFTVAGYLPLSDMDVDHPQGIRFMLPFVRKEFDESLVNDR